MKIRSVQIRETKKNDIEKSGYYNVFGDKKLAKIFRKVQSTTIRNGNELEKIILSKIEYTILDSNTTPTNILLRIRRGEDFFVPNWNLSKTDLNSVGIELKGKNSIRVDGFLFKENKIYIMEFKQGDSLDTKKSQSEMESLQKIKDYFKILGFDVYPKLVLWVSDDINNSSIKTTENREYIITGKEVCELMDIPFDEIQKIREKDQKDNIDWLFEEISKIKKED